MVRRSVPEMAMMCEYWTMPVIYQRNRLGYDRADFSSPTRENNRSKLHGDPDSEPFSHQV
jgi:hypothetical protein